MKQMFPCAAHADMPHVGGFGVEVLRDGFVCESFGPHTTDLDHVGFGQFGKVRGLSTMGRLTVGGGPGMALIPERGDVFQVVHPVVCSVTVNVVDVVSGRLFANEDLGDKLMDEPQFASSVRDDADTPVPLSVVNASEGATIHAPNASKVADFMIAVAPRNRFPDFIHAQHCNSLQCHSSDSYTGRG